MQIHQSGRHLATTLLIVATLSLGCDDSTGPLTGAIGIIVSTAGETIDRDPDGYILSIDGAQAQAVDVNASLSIANLPAGTHLVRLTVWPRTAR